jgi:sucrose phosphorylase
VQHQDNIRYFGNGHDEAQMVYNFALPPLVLYTFQNGNSKKLTTWAKSLKKISDTATYFNFLDSHDGIGVMAVKNILTVEELELLALKIIEHGGFISYKAEGDGSEVPYELNITWYSAINRDDSDEPRELKNKRYLASRAIALVLMGVPGIYLHGLLGSKNDAEAVIKEGHRRSINRKTISKKELSAELENTDSNIFQVASGLTRLVQYRIREKCFHPNAPQSVIGLSEKVFSVLRTSVDGQEKILAIINIINKRENLSIDLKDKGLYGGDWQDILTKKTFKAKDGRLEIILEPYDILWLKEKDR